MTTEGEFTESASLNSRTEIDVQAHAFGPMMRHLLLGLYLGLSTGCVSKTPVSIEQGPVLALQASSDPASVLEASSARMRERDQLFAALLARGRDSNISRRLYTLSLAESVARIHSHDAARKLASILPGRELYDIGSQAYAVSGDGRYATSFEFDRSSDRTCGDSRPANVTYHDLATRMVVGKQWLSPPFAIGSAALSHDGRFLALAGGGRVMVVDARDGTSVFNKRLAPCVDEPMGETSWQFAWHPNGEAIAVHRVEELFTGQNKGAIVSNELVVWLPTGQELVRESVDPANSRAARGFSRRALGLSDEVVARKNPSTTSTAAFSGSRPRQNSRREATREKNHDLLDLNTVAGRTALWTRLGFPSAVDGSSDRLRFEQHDGVYQVLDAKGQREGVFALSTPSNRARPIAGHPELAIVEHDKRFTVLDWTDAGMFAAVCESAKGGLNPEEWATQLPHWLWKSRCGARPETEPSVPKQDLLATQLASNWQQLFELALAQLEREPPREEVAMLVRAHALQYLDSVQLRTAVTKTLAKRPRITALPSHGRVGALLPNPDDNRVALFLDDGRVELRDATTGVGEVIDTLGPDEFADDVHWAGGELVHMGWRAGIVELRTLGPQGQSRSIKLTGHGARPKLGLSPDGTRLVSVEGTRTGKIEIWSTASRSRLYHTQTLKRRDCVCCCGSTCDCPQEVNPELFFRPDSRYLAVKLDQQTAIFDLPEARALPRVDGGGTSIAFGTDNLFLYQAIRDFELSSVNVFSLATGDLVEHLIESNSYKNADFVFEGHDSKAMLALEAELTLTSAKLDGDRLIVEDPRMKPGMLLRVAQDRAAVVSNDRTLNLLPRLPPGDTLALTGDRRTLLSIDKESGRVVRLDNVERDTRKLVENRDELRAAVCEAVTRDLNIKQWREHVGDVPFTPLCDPASEQPCQ